MSKPSGRPPLSRPSLLASISALTTLTLLATTACAGPAGKGEGDAVASELHVYMVRGVLRSLPAPESERPEILVRHEAIDDFVGINGEVVGMDSMSMPFPLAPRLDLSGVAPGDKVLLRLEVDWSAEEPARVTAIERLDPEAELEFRAARP